MRLRTLILLGGAGLVLAGCGLRGDLERPGPIFGSGTSADATEEEAPEDPNAPVPIEPDNR
jgi:hypothetical protein